MKRFDPAPYITIFILALAIGAALLALAIPAIVTQPLIYQLANQLTH